MAHVGRDYPVHFRRDLNLVVTNNRRGYARAYDCFANDKSGSIGLALNRQAMHVHAVDETTFEFAKWTQDYQPVAGFNVKFTIELSPTKGDVYKGPSLEIRERSIGILATYSALVPGTAGYSTITWNVDLASLTHPTLYNDTVTLRAGAQAIKWTEYHSIYG